MDWDGRTMPGPNAPCVSFDAVPAPPDGFPDWIAFLLQTSGESAELDRLGSRLYSLLIAGDIYESLRQARADGPLRLLLKVEPPELDALPWELMRSRTMLMFTNVLMTVARVASFFNPDLEPPDKCWPLRMMLVVGSQDEQIHVEEEIGYIKEAFRKVCGLVDLEVARLPDRKGVRKMVGDVKPHVVHFIGHGDVDGEVGYLELEQPGTSNIKWTASAIRDDLSRVIKDQRSGEEVIKVPRLVVLNACQSGEPGEHRGTRAAAEGLAELNVPAVIAMQGPIRGRAAALFASGLYETLSHGEPLDRAVTRARVEITDELSQDQRDYALPALILGAPPERILDLSHCDPARRLTAQPLKTALSFVDRVPKRRQLWDGLWTDQQTDPRIFAITGPGKAGKGSLVRWCLGVASVLGYPTVLAEIESGEYLDSASFLDALTTGPESSEVAAALVGLRADLAKYRYRQERAAARGLPYDESPLPLYEKLASVLAAVAAQQTLLIGIDGLAGVESGTWAHHAVRGLVGPIARGQAGNVRLVVALQENERDLRFPVKDFDRAQIAEIPIKLFPAAEFVELVNQKLRALGYTHEKFDGLVAFHAKDINQQDCWGTDYFEIFSASASAGKWEQE
jgi:CHAT domain